METVPTISEFITQCRGSLEFDPYGENIPPDTGQVAIAFAKLHVEAAVEAIIEKVRMIGSPVHNFRLPQDIDVTHVMQCNDNTDDFMYEIDMESIRNAYPLENLI